MFSYGDERMDISASGFDDKDRELLGRRTYEKFEAYWPYQPDDHPISKRLNAAKKYVASSLEDAPLEQLNPAPRLAIIALKAQPGSDLQIIGIGEDFGGYTSGRSFWDILRKIPDEISG
jgi:dihydrofolate reductase